MTKLNAREEIRQKFSKYQADLYSQSTLAYIGKEDGTVYVEERPGYIWASIANAPPIQVLNRRVPATLGMPVIVGVDPYEPWLVQVLSSATTASDGGQAFPSTVGPHGLTHAFLGADPVWVDKRQILPGKIGPASYYSGSVVSGSAAVDIYPDILIINGAPVELPYQVINLSANIPTAGQSRYVLLSVDSSGSVIVTEGTAVSGYTPALSDAPAIPSGNIALGYVRLYGGMTGTNDNATYTDFLDIRTMIPNTAVTSGSSVSGGADILQVQIFS